MEENRNLVPGKSQIETAGEVEVTQPEFSHGGGYTQVRHLIGSYHRDVHARLKQLPSPTGMDPFPLLGLRARHGLRSVMESPKINHPSKSLISSGGF